MAEGSGQEDRYTRKLAELQKHVPFIETMISHLKNTKEGSREVQLTKMESLYTMITDTKRKFKYEILLKCEEVIDKLKSRMKPNTTSNSSNSTKETVESPKNMDNQQNISKTVKEITATDPKKPEDERIQCKTANLGNDNGESDSRKSSDEANCSKQPNSTLRGNSAERPSSSELEMDHPYRHHRERYNRRYRPFSLAKASKQNVILPLLLAAMKDDDTPPRSGESFDPNCLENDQPFRPDRSRYSQSCGDYAEASNSRESWHYPDDNGFYPNERSDHHRNRLTPPDMYASRKYKNFEYYQSGRNASYRGSSKHGYSRYEDNSYRSNSEAYKCRARPSDRFFGDEESTKSWYYSQDDYDFSRENSWRYNNSQENELGRISKERGDNYENAAGISRVKVEDGERISSRGGGMCKVERSNEEIVAPKTPKESSGKGVDAKGVGQTKFGRPNEEIEVSKTPKESSVKGVDGRDVGKSKFQGSNEKIEVTKTPKESSVKGVDGRDVDKSKFQGSNEKIEVTKTPKESSVKGVDGRDVDKSKFQGSNEAIELSKKSKDSSARRVDISLTNSTEPVLKVENGNNLVEMKRPVDNSKVLRRSIDMTEGSKEDTESLKNVRQFENVTTKDPSERICKEFKREEELEATEQDKQNVATENKKHSTAVATNISAPKRRLRNNSKDLNNLATLHSNITVVRTDKPARCYENKSNKKQRSEQRLEAENLAKVTANGADVPKAIKSAKICPAPISSKSDEEPSNTNDNDTTYTYSKYDKMYSNMTKTRVLKTPLESLYSEGVGTTKFKIPKKQSQQGQQEDESSISTGELEQHGSKIEVKVIIEHFSESNNKSKSCKSSIKKKSCKNIVSAPEFVVKDKDKLKTYSKRDSKSKVTTVKKGDSKEFKVKKRRKIIRVADEDSDEEIEEKIEIETSSKEMVGTRNEDSCDMGGESKLMDETLKVDQSLNESLNLEVKNEEIKDREDKMDLKKCESEEPAAIGTRETVEEVKIKDSSSNTVEEKGKGDEATPDRDQTKTVSRAVSDPTELLDFILKNYKQIKKIFKGNSSSDEESKSRKKKKKKSKHKKKKRRYSSSSSSSSSSTDSSSSDQEDGHSSKRRKRKRHSSEESSSKHKKSEEIAVETIANPTEAGDGDKQEAQVATSIDKDPIKKKKFITELDRLHQDIKEMWMSDEIVKATGKRSCTISKGQSVQVANTPAPTPAVMIENAARLKVVVKREDFSDIKKIMDNLRRDREEKIEPSRKKARCTGKRKFSLKVLDVKNSDSSKDPFVLIEEIARLSAENLHDKDYYTTVDKIACKLCTYKGKNLTTHYKRRHKNYEVLCSRLSPKLTEQLIKQSALRNFATLELNDGPKDRYRYICPFCPNIVVQFTSGFYDHLTSHTGEYRHCCDICDYSCYYAANLNKHYSKHENKGTPITKPAPPNSNIVFGYVCAECFFVQTLKENLDKHVEIHHDGSGEIFKVDLNIENLYLDRKSPEESMDDDSENALQIKAEGLILLEVVENEQTSSEIVKQETTITSMDVWSESITSETNVGDSSEQSSGLGAFICETDPEDEKIDQKRLNKMNQILQNVAPINTRTSIVDKLQYKLVSGENENVQSKYGSPVKSTVIKQKTKPSRMFISENTEGNSPRDDENAGKKVDTICNIINRLQDNLQPQKESAVEDTKVNSDISNDLLPPLIHYKELASPPDSKPQSPVRIYTNSRRLAAKITQLRDQAPGLAQKTVEEKIVEEQPPPLIHYKHANPKQRAKVVVRAGPITLLRTWDDVIIYSCAIKLCNFRTDEAEIFAKHCKIGHYTTRSNTWRCQECGIPFHCTLYAVFVHVRDVHAEPMRRMLTQCGEERAAQISNTVSENQKYKLVITSVHRANEPTINSIDSTSTLVDNASTLVLTPTIPCVTESSSALTLQSPSISNPPPEKKEYLRPVPLSKLLASESDVLPHASTSVDSQVPPSNLTDQNIPVNPPVNTLSKTPYAANCLLDVSRIPHFYKCPVFDCTYSAFVEKDFAKHCKSEHTDSYVRCIYCPTIIKLSFYTDHLRQFHHSSRYACSHCFYRASSVSYLKAHIDMEHKDVNKVLIVSTPPETLPPRLRDTYPPIESFIRPFILNDSGNKFSTLFEKALLIKVGSVRAQQRLALCGYCKLPLYSKDSIRHFATWHGIFRYHCRYCGFGDTLVDPLIQHMTREHYNLPLCMLSRIKRGKQTANTDNQVNSDDYKYLLVKEESIRSKYSYMPAASFSERSKCIPVTNYFEKFRSKEPPETPVQEPDEVVQSINQFPLPAYKRNLRKSGTRTSKRIAALASKEASTQAEIAQFNATVSITSSDGDPGMQNTITPDESDTETIIQTTAPWLINPDGTIYPLCPKCGIQVNKPVCSHLEVHNPDTDNRTVTATAIENLFLDTKRGFIVLKNKLFSKSIINPKIIPSTTRFYCSALDCKKAFRNKADFEYHLRLCHSENLTYTCEHCKVVMDFESKPINIPSIVKHFMLHGDPLKCPNCCYMDDCARSMRDHVVDMHRKIYHNAPKKQIAKKKEEVFSIVNLPAPTTDGAIDTVPEITKITEAKGVATDKQGDAVVEVADQEEEEVIVLSNSEDEMVDVERNDEGEEEAPAPNKIEEAPAPNKIEEAPAPNKIEEAPAPNTIEATVLSNDIDASYNRTEEDGDSNIVWTDLVASTSAENSSSTSSSQYREGFVKPDGPHASPSADTYKCPMCHFVTTQALNMYKHLWREVSCIKLQFLGTDASKAEVTKWMYDLIRYQTRILYYWRDSSKVKEKMCKFCPFMGNLSETFQHRLTHYSEYPYACNSCIYTTRQKKSLEKHHLSAHQKATNAYIIVRCTPPGENESFLMKIMTEDDYKCRPDLSFEDNQGVCRFCGFIGTYPELLLHYKKRHPRSQVENFKFTCSMCTSADFESAEVFAVHNGWCHSGKAKATATYVGNKLRCVVCSELFRDQSAHASHLQTHSSCYKCRLCDYSIYSWRCLRKHYFDEHNGESYDFLYEINDANVSNISGMYT